LVVANPLNFFVQESKHFSKRKFRSIATGTPVSAVVSLLGAPIKIVPSAPEAECAGCAIYYFMGDPAPWLIGFEEAWLIVDSKGIVIQSVEHSEP
jgi:hypothetical protein